MDKINPSQAMEELTLMLLYLSKFSETDRFFDKKDYYAWKGYAFKILNEFEEKDYIRQGSHPSRSKSVYITPDGLEHARNLLERYHITDREKEDRPKNEKTPL
ncbi:MAG: transposase [Lachnospiraceae bacterium]|jgi:DNA-binding PadR family transcriptional regulator|nr:transposase [Lachnospiraceae bacterium]